MNTGFFYWFYRWEGCLHIPITENKNYKLGWEVRLIFTIGVDEKDHALLEQIKNYFGVGLICKQGQNSIQFRVE